MPRRRPVSDSTASPIAPMSSTGTIDLEVERLADTGVDHADLARAPRSVEPAEEPRDLLERPLRGGEPDPLRRPLPERRQPLERQHQVRPALRGRERVDLVDDHGLDVAERLARRRGEHQVERLGGRDEDVGRMRHQPAPLAGVGVAGADADRRHMGQGPARRARPRARSPRAAPAGSSRRRRRARAAGERYRTRVVRSPSGGGVVASRSIAQRNAARVLPDPVGASRSVCAPAVIGGQPCRLGVGGRRERGLEPGPRVGGERLERHGSTTLPAPSDTGRSRPRLRCGDAPRRPHRPRSRRARSCGADRGVGAGRRAAGAGPGGARRATSWCRPGTSSGEVVVCDGDVTVDGVVDGDVIVLRGSITVAGQVRGDVVSVSRRRPAAPDRAGRGGSVLAGETAEVEAGAQVAGGVTQGVRYSLGSAVADDRGAPRAGRVRRVDAARCWPSSCWSRREGWNGSGRPARTAPFAAAGWGVLSALGVAVAGSPPAARSSGCRSAWRCSSRGGCSRWSGWRGHDVDDRPARRARTAVAERARCSPGGRSRRRSVWCPSERRVVDARGARCRVGRGGGRDLARARARRAVRGGRQGRQAPRRPRRRTR